jgi:hypothetical protein
VSDRFAGWFHGVDLKTREGHSVLTGILDQSQLYGIFARIQDLDLEIVSVAEILEDEQLLLSEGWTSCSLRDHESSRYEVAEHG